MTALPSSDLVIEGLDAQEAEQLLHECCTSVHWFDRSEFLADTARQHIPRFHAHRRLHYEGLVRPRNHHLEGFAVSFGPEDVHAERPWLAYPGLRLLAADRDIVAQAADKLSVLSIFKAAGVQSPPSLALLAEGGFQAFALRCEYAGELVVVPR